jgi:ubiquinone/menaquinone biosynthesis C-methylase UbiE
MGRIARRRLIQENLGYQLITGKAQAVPFQNCSIRCVVATFPSEYIFDAETLSEIWRVLLPGGSMVILPGGWITGRGLLDRAAAWLFRTTGQAPFVSQMETLLLEGLRKSGYEVEVKYIDLQSSRLLLMLAEKPP